jgi:hypothetical protein
MMSDPELRHLQDVITDLYKQLGAAKEQAMQYYQAVERHKVMRMSSRQRVSGEDKELWDGVLRQTPEA